ncbi:protein RALF-like 34 [Cynara cardunculus var. scolymus]|uniref:Rapid ALkalinization Factor n=1 Tax=Cynara cardunculus var. scolymus TaxID=59895 RepID=A0A103Y531_CYNCS|nr:protein RALF-like 34 [Cynara cardunculus var. scolymus]KVI02681.1 Rapid ALkalinization Factor [Cynara cardunculus var. scolymus]
MASPLLHLLLPLCLILLALTRASGGDATKQLALHLVDAEMEMSIYGGFDEIEGEDDENESVSDRRSLFWRRMRYYISYGALSANRVPCPPRSGRSYYTHNCWRAKGRVRPYTRGCSTITRCRR